MRVKCRGFEGTLRSLDLEYYVEYVAVYEVEIYLNGSNDYVRLSNVSASEITFL